ncbi:RNA polymerase sigma factor [Arthrobacter sp. H14]|uniref:RNA polymerase sigma factor n=1 Tax=Arthrobacter sp. H14 TaxID=1312959 RepID=UPI0004B6D7F3|nr:RNA polymerase sigma factor [Arthrobacter sp. H14]
MEQIDKVPAQSVTEIDEITVISRAQDGDLAAFERLVNTYQGRIFRLAYRMLFNTADAEDIVQETMIAAWRQLPALVSPAAFSGWIYRVSTNRCLDLLRQRRTHQETPTGNEELEHQSRTGGIDQHAAVNGPAEEAELSAQLDQLAQILETISPEQRACWLLREMHGHSYAQIADMLQTTEPAVRGRIARARNQLAERMVQWR